MGEASLAENESFSYVVCKRHVWDYDTKDDFAQYQGPSEISFVLDY